MSKGCSKRKVADDTIQVRVLRRHWLIRIAGEIVEFRSERNKLHTASLEKFKDASGRFRLDQALHHIAKKYS